MTISDEDRARILKLHEEGVSYRAIGVAFGKTKNAIAKIIKRAKEKAFLGEKTIFKKRLTNGRVGLQIKKIVQETPKIAVADLQLKLRELSSPNKSSDSTWWIFCHVLGLF